MSEMSAIFACSKCLTRHPFEELSQGQQLCKECRGAFPVVKCTFCRSEFQQTNKSSTSTICKKCEQNVKLYGKPSACEYCNIIAAFIGNKCQRCTNSEKKCGPPVTCEQCKQKSAFDRKDEDKKVDGKLLCWLCTVSYKRALAKTKQSESERRSHIKLAAHRAGGKSKEHHQKHGHHRSHNKRPNRVDVTKLGNTEDGAGGGSGGPPAKVGRVSSSVGSVTTAATVSTSREPPDPNSSDHVVAMTQLKETIASLQKQLNLKDQQMLSKDKQITELKAKHFTVENDLRNKMKNVQKEHENKVEVLLQKIKALQKEVATLSKGKNKVLNNSATSNKDVAGSGSGTDSPSIAP
ncbi:protein FAM76A [Ischnura elegans]|uniref:protein FAM76A n=1 Tax=Ischnura elegans TaxID=197161 RepID=UPI001ED86C3E|nr:protein FAM76A [Ischnura elegans]